VLLLGVVYTLVRLARSARALHRRQRRARGAGRERTRKCRGRTRSWSGRAAIADALELDAQNAEQVAARAEPSQERFLANMSHEIRTPMNA